MDIENKYEDSTAIYNNSVDKQAVAIFGGTFDPPHKGHLRIAEEILERELAGEVIIVPAAKPPHKLDRKISSGKHRLEMLDRMIESKDNISVSDYEIVNNRRNSYTITTLKAFSAIYPGREIALVIGMDNFHDFKSWFKYSEILNNFRLIIFTRPGYKEATFSEINDKYGSRIAKKLENSIIELNIDIAATDIRKKIINDENISADVPLEVRLYINEHKIYG